MAERRQKITDEGALHRYRTEIPNTVIRGMLGKGLSLPARWLYVYLKSVAGDSGECWQNMTTLAVGSRLSRGAVSNARKELVAAKLIAVTKGKGALHETDRIRILDIWNQNMAEFANGTSSSGELESSSLTESEEKQPNIATIPSHEVQVHVVNPRVHVVNLASSCSEPKKISKDKKEEKASPIVPSPPLEEHQVSRTMPPIEDGGISSQIEKGKGESRISTAKAIHLLEYMNRVHNRKLENPSQIEALLRSKKFIHPVSMEDCKLVIDYLQEVVRKKDPDAYAKWVDSITPFRPDNFERHRDKAREWDEKGRGSPIRKSSNSGPYWGEHTPRSSHADD